MGHPEVSALDEVRAAELITALAHTVIGVPSEFALSTGVRRGERLALRWDDLDLERRQFRVVRSLEQLKGGDYRFERPKTKKSRRVVRLSVQR